MTAMPHDMPGETSHNSGFTARLVRPVTSRRPFTGSGSDKAQSTQSEPLMSGSAGGGAAALGSGARPLSVTSVSSALGLSHVRFVLSGRRVRLGNGAFVLAILGACTAILFALLLLNTFLAENSFQLQSIREKSRQLVVQEQTLSGQLAAAESPIGLEDKARQLGMVAAGSPVFLNLEDGRLLGEGEPAAMPAPAKPKKPKTAAPEEQSTTTAPVGETPFNPSLPVGGEVPVGSAPVIAGEVGQGAPLAGEQPAASVETPRGGEQPVGLVSGATR